METGIMIAGAVFIATVVSLYLTRGISVLSFIMQLVPMCFAALYINIDVMTRIEQGTIAGQFGYIVMATVLVVAVITLNRSLQQDSIKSYRENEH